MVLMKDVNHRDVLVGHCNYALDDQNLDVSHANRNCVRRDRSLGVMMDGNLCRRKNDLLDDRRDLNLVAKMDGKSHHVK
jgi:hypothetical protein